MTCSRTKLNPHRHGIFGVAGESLGVLMRSRSVSMVVIVAVFQKSWQSFLSLTQRHEVQARTSI